MLTSSALDYLGLTKQFGRKELELYSAELSKQLPGLFIHLSSEVRQNLLPAHCRTGGPPPYSAVQNNMRSLEPVLLSIEQDVQNKLATVSPSKSRPSTTLDLSLPTQSTQ
ncbi:hypothetical protein WG219_16745 [Ectopseudomonas mendocina]|uniref:Uncharacterized protein n=1 Tax=Ectopseudomonas mendocina TaxID=300 RepID=A0ABZ2RF34_ECTME